MLRLLIAFLLAIPMVFSSAFAISQAQLKENPERYKLVYSEGTDAEYVDVQSIQSIQYKPPYYQIRAIVYAVDLKIGMIAKFTNIYSYNSDRSVKNLLKAGFTKKDVVAEMTRDNGLSFRFEYAAFYGVNGEPITYEANVQTLGFNKAEPVLFNSPPYHVSTFLFYKVHNKYFNPPVKGQLF